MNLTYRFTNDGVSWDDLEALFKKAQLGGRAGDKIRRAFVKSAVVCFAYDASRLVGASRAITDGEYHAVIYDVVVHPDWQRHGIGTQMISELLQRLPVWRILLVADGDVKDFYRRFGFDDYTDVMARFEPDRLYDDPARG